MEIDGSSEFRCGFAVLLGKPNAGKSTLLNELLETKLAAVSALPQTTRVRLNGIYSDDRRQIIFVDLPGVCQPDDNLNECLLASVRDAAPQGDVLLHLVDVHDSNPLTPEIESILGEINLPMILVLTKLDGKSSSINIEEWFAAQSENLRQIPYKSKLGISSIQRKGLGGLLSEISSFLPEGPPLYDPEDLTDKTLRELSEELIREKAFLHLHQELPYSTAVQIEEFQEKPDGKWFIRAVIYVERDSQKGMVIGKGGQMLKTLSTEARQEIEKLCQVPVYLELWVKVRHKWRKKDHHLKEFGYLPAKGKKQKKRR